MPFRLESIKIVDKDGEPRKLKVRGDVGNGVIVEYLVDVEPLTAFHKLEKDLATATKGRMKDQLELFDEKEGD